MIELLLSLALIGLLAVPLFTMFTSGTVATHQVVETTRALQIATSELERLRGLPFSEILALPARRPIDPGELPRPFEGELERVDVSPGELVRVTVRVRWKLADRIAEKVELATFFGDPAAR